MPLTIIKHHIDQFLTTLSISFTGVLAAVKFDLFALNINAAGETMFLFLGGFASTTYLVFKALNEINNYNRKRDKFKKR